MKKHKNITKYTYRETSFYGYRVAVSRGGRKICRYFSVKSHGSEKEALQAALGFRQSIREDFEAVYEACAAAPKA
ncbi:AP2 domain-containing protein [Akkermansia glycaniphila]|uniref:Ap2 domain n=1 Tax=Akkermansia glycaniphila TaxID=1679444 RepID=A0A1C7PDS5_9BACT|nr:AP2 domain-containing protein [Akkermansia glycaniphila]OCA02182.1 hypothetical protein AC781_11525 [Akkermansia glycaniphila]SEH99448.1 ap2 domain [Akkermansia glycaniphila]